jgi:hypothetical protein
LGWVVAASRKRGAFWKGGRVAGWPGSRVADLVRQLLHVSTNLTHFIFNITVWVNTGMQI